jgi:hypothetical protein
MCPEHNDERWLGGDDDEEEAAAAAAAAAAAGKKGGKKGAAAAGAAAAGGLPMSLGGGLKVRAAPLVSGCSPVVGLLQGRARGAARQGARVRMPPSGPVLLPTRHTLRPPAPGAVAGAD